MTNDLSYDQRMIRICTSLVKNGYEVTLVGRKMRGSRPLDEKVFRQQRMRLLFQQGKAFYIEYNLRLFFFLLFKDMDLICAVDLDTILPCYLLSRLRGITRVYDAHELFCEMKEVVNRPRVYKVWKAIERKTVPAFQHGYTVNDLIAGEFRKMYQADYEVIRNVPLLKEAENPPPTDGGTVPDWLPRERFILYQGAVNEGRCFETLIPAMQQVEAPLVICGEGNFMRQAREMVRHYRLEGKVIFAGYLLPVQLKSITPLAYCGITLFDKTSGSNYYSLANRFFDYMHACVPQLAMNFPAYREINNLCPIAVLIDEADTGVIADALNGLLHNNLLYQTMRENCRQARLVYNWESEEKKLFHFYKQILN